MFFAFIIYTAFVVIGIVYLLYPLWLLIGLRKTVSDSISLDASKLDVSVILLTYNGGDFVKQKALLLLDEISVFRNSELVIIDDCSSDACVDFVDNIETDKVKIIRKCERKGIPDSMNTAVNSAVYENIVFCDQRQNISAGSIAVLVNELETDDTGAVSSCISHISRDNCFSVIRKYENIIKKLESGSGSLIGVYGPLYAIKKGVYTDIPDEIILDDLYLSMKILTQKKIKFVSSCLIYDEDVNKLFDYQRIRRYLAGFYQVVSDKTLMKSLNWRHKLMLFWHKYLRLAIPLLFFISVIVTGILALNSTVFAIAFGAVLTGIIYSLLNFSPQVILTNSIRINIYYFIAFFDLMIFGIKRIYDKN